MLETWLIVDGRAISKVLSRPTHKVRINGRKKPEQIRKPKGWLKNTFKKHRKTYNELTDAEKIIKNIPNLAKIQTIDSFRRFALKLTDKTL